ncbi:MAG: isorenieratene synthase, partial [Alphaproteobacteria bacterium]|nr:isorenieratene synthase [Alphaproteobacteria bacterium]
FDGDDTYLRFDTMTAAEYLDRVRFPAAARQLLFEVFAHSFFNAEEEMSAGELLMMFHLYFLGTSEGILFDVLDEPFGDALWRPLGRLLDRLGVDVRLDSRVTDIDPDAQDGVVLACDVAGLQHVVAANRWIASPPTSTALGGSGGPDTTLSVDVGAGSGDAWRARVAALPTAPPFAVWRLWLDRAPAPERAPFAGTAGLGIIDNISIVDRYQGEAHRWALRHGGSVVELHAYALARSYCGDRERVTAELWQQLVALYPELRRANVLDDRYLERADCPGFPPGSWADRLTTATPDRRVVVAGDFVRLSLPTALMERAVASGILAANTLLDRWGVAPEPVWSIAPLGTLARLQRWQRSRQRPAAE